MPVCWPGSPESSNPPELLLWFLSAEAGKCAKLGVALPLAALMGGLPIAAPALGVQVSLPQQVGPWVGHLSLLLQPRLERVHDT